jgi:nucleotide-binding universal stress UspA family protein
LFDRILVGYLSDRAGRDAVALAAQLRSLLAGKLTVLFPYHPLLSSTTAQEAEARVAQEVQALLTGFGEQEQPTCHWTSSSWPIRALHEFARYEKSELIVFGGARERLADRLHISLTERMLHGAPCAVALAPVGYAERGAHPLRRVGVGFAATDEGLVALRVAHRLAVAAAGELEIIAGVCLDPALASYAFSSAAVEEVEREMYTQTRGELERLASELGGEVRVEHREISHDAVTALLERSSELDLLVLGSRAYGPVRHVLLGSVSARAAREASCPVVIVPRGVDPTSSQPPAA